MMSNSYTLIVVRSDFQTIHRISAILTDSLRLLQEHSDIEWKFARTKLWMRYFEEGGTLPPPFNLIPAPKLLFRLCGVQKKDPRKRCSIRRRVQEHR